MDITGKWQVEKKDDFDAAMKTTVLIIDREQAREISGPIHANLGIPEVFAKCSPDMKLQLEISRDGDKYMFREMIMLPLSEHTAKLGKGFETVNWLGKPIKGVVEKEGNKIVEKSKEGDIPYVITFQTDGSRLIRTRDYASTQCSLTYTKV